MNKSSVYKSILIFLIILSSSCQADVQSSITPPAGYLHFFPPKKHPVRLEFNYPDSWIMEDSDTYIDRRIISFSDPEDPNSREYDLSKSVSTYGLLSITGYYSEYQKDLDDWLEELISAGKKSPVKNELLNDYSTVINGNSYRILEYRLEPSALEYSVPMIEKDMFLITDDGWYEIYFVIAESDIGNEFSKEVDKLIESIRIVP